VARFSADSAYFETQMWRIATLFVLRHPSWRIRQAVDPLIGTTFQVIDTRSDAFRVVMSEMGGIELLAPVPFRRMPWGDVLALRTPSNAALMLEVSIGICGTAQPGFDEPHGLAYRFITHASALAFGATASGA
jgi:hypothetical protein